MKDDAGRLQDILEAVQRIEKYAGRGRAAFNYDELVQTWILHYLQIIGEAASGISPLCKPIIPKSPGARLSP